MLSARLTSFLAVLAAATVMTSGPAAADPTPEPSPTQVASPVAEVDSPDPAEVLDAPDPAEVGPLPDPSPSTTTEPQSLPDASEDTRPDGHTTSDGQTPTTAAAAVYALQFAAPAQGAVVPAGELTWQLQSSAEQYYDINLTCATSGTQWGFVYSSYDGELVSGTFVGLAAADSCQVQAQGNSTGETTSVTFTTQAPIPEVRNLKVGPATFYPHVRDRYRDSAAIGFTSRLDSRVEVRVSNRDGRTVWSRKLAAHGWADYYERRVVRWSGRSNAGHVVRTGRYRVTVTATITGTTRTARSSVVVARGTRAFKVTRTKDGWADSVDATSGNCYTSNYYPGNHLDCWSGNYARADYRFRVPANARINSWSVRGQRLCCTQGRLTKTGTRTNSRTFRVRVQVTGWRGYVVRRATLTYSYRKAI